MVAKLIFWNFTERCLKRCLLILHPVKIRKRIAKKVDFSPYLTWSLLGWKDKWADEKRSSEIVRVDNISKITSGVVHGLVEKLSKSPFFKKKKMSVIVLKARPCSSNCPPIQEVDETWFCAKKSSSVLKAKKNYSKNRQGCRHLFKVLPVSIFEQRLIFEML